MPSPQYTVTLPSKEKLTFEGTDDRVPVREIKDGECFLCEGEVWEKLPGSCGNLSNFDDESEVRPHVLVERLKEVPQPAPQP